MILASKLWDDDSLENEHFPTVMKDVTMKEITNFERIFLDLIGYDLTINGPEYAKCYFLLRSLGKENGVVAKEMQIGGKDKINNKKPK
eukprot:CAMPEP_0205808196 /NCGR_PEP_ID=MMETSP0205-20121125/12076_1 /ASSEMBLY_ACC=CAM_ASM_000278 /TAXON_ID=36767 /ORGANISM="Euplotes focardii, Strain TN1" /LENGTH=87 /DNA_ID=CAMNT_0053083485 /DNA_START=620 /DNA_END=880 /DNA_ORIENTATION=+